MKKIFNNNKIIKKMEDRNYSVIFLVIMAFFMAFGLVFLMNKTNEEKNHKEEPYYLLENGDSIRLI